MILDRFDTERFPFNWKNPIGYCVSVSLQIIVVLYPMRYLASFSTLALGAYLFAVSSVKVVTADIKASNDNTDLLLKSPTFDIYRKFSELIDLHSDAKQLSVLKNRFKYYTQILRLFHRLIGVFSRLFEITITILFTASIVAVCIALLMIQMEIVSYSNYFFNGV